MNKLSKFCAVTLAIALSMMTEKQAVHAAQIVVSCSTSRYNTQVIYDALSKNYTYVAYDRSSTKNSPSLVLKNGKVESGRTAYYYTFKNGVFSYVIAKRFEGRGGAAFLNVYKSGKQIFQEQCQ